MTEGARHRRFAPPAVPVHDLRGDPRLRWATSATASSEYSASYPARAACGPPQVFPKGGDYDHTWLSDNTDRSAWLELRFTPLDLCYGFVALETCGAGAIVRATDAEGVVLFESPLEIVPARKAHLLCVEFEAPRALHTVRLHVSPRVRDYREVDAVALLACPFADLAAAAPPPPPPPVPGAPVEGFTDLVGTLHGHAPLTPLVHLTLSSATATVNVNVGGPATLRLDDGQEVTLELAETCIYGAPLLRREAAFGTLARELPWLRPALGRRAPSDAALVTLTGTQLVAGERVYAAGTPMTAAAGGFRDTARRLEGLRAAALSSRPLSSTPFPTRGVQEFARQARTSTDGPPARHPLAPWRRVATGLVGLSASAAAALWLTATDVRGIHGGRAAALVVALVALLGSTVFALELHGRATLVTVVRRGRDRGRAPVRATSPGWTAAGTGILLFLAATLAAALAASAAGDALGITVRLALIVGGVHALVRLVVWRWAERGVLRRTLPLLLAAQGQPREGARGLFAGALGRALRTTETLTAHSEHLGTYQSTDEQGHVTTHDRYREWNTCEITCDAGPATTVFLADGTELSLGSLRAVVDAGMVPGATHPPAYLRLESAHGVGDSASLLGLAVGRDGTWEVRDALLLLGDRRALARATAHQLLALLGLLTLVGAGLLAALL